VVFKDFALCDRASYSIEGADLFGFKVPEFEFVVVGARENEVPYTVNCLYFLLVACEFYSDWFFRSLKKVSTSFH